MVMRDSRGKPRKWSRKLEGARPHGFGSKSLEQNSKAITAAGCEAAFRDGEGESESQGGEVTVGACSVCEARADVNVNGVLFCMACFEDRERTSKDAGAISAPEKAKSETKRPPE